MNTTSKFFSILFLQVIAITANEVSAPLSRKKQKALERAAALNQSHAATVAPRYDYNSITQLTPSDVVNVLKQANDDIRAGTISPYDSRIATILRETINRARENHFPQSMKDKIFNQLGIILRLTQHGYTLEEAQKNHPLRKPTLK